MKRKHARVKPPPATETTFVHEHGLVVQTAKASPLPNRAERREMYRKARRGRGGASASNRSALPRV